MEIQNHHILVTGSNRGIGRAIAKMSAESGAHVHIAVRKEDKEFTEELRKAGAASVKVWICDLGTREGTEKLLQDLKNETIDILINNAGQLTGGLIEEQPLDEIYSMFQVNLLSLVHLSRGLIPGMIARKRGKIVNNSSVSAFMHFPCASTYAASKAAVVAFTDCIRAELKETGVTALCLITPGIKTRMFEELTKKYGKNFDLPTETISTTQYAQMIREAILLDLEELQPKGMAGLGLKVAKYVPALFRFESERRFRR